MRGRNLLQEYLKHHKLLADGAFGTYYAQKYATDQLPEKANITDAERVLTIHREYLEAGAELIRTNTFACNTQALHMDRENLAKYIKAGCELAFCAVRESDADAEEPHFIAGDIGPIPRENGEPGAPVAEEYIYIAKVMYESGIRIFLFETFAGAEEILPAIEWIKDKSHEDCFVWVQLCSNQHGYTNQGLHVRKIISTLAKDRRIDAVGLNCGIGPSSMEKILDGIDFSKEQFVSALPNASFPQRSFSQSEFAGNEGYFAAKMEEILSLGVDIVGGCCGTTPHYIKELSELSFEQKKERCFHGQPSQGTVKIREKDSAFWADAFSGDKRTNGDKLIAVELAPPFGADDQKIMDAANALTKLPVHAITFPDSPSGRTRADSILMGLKVASETGIAAIPHICCRDRNVIGLRSSLLGAYLNGMRNALIITGDPVPTLMRQEAKSVFNFDSTGLMRILKEMNEEEFYKDPVTFGGALAYNRPNMEVELARLEKKIHAGASFFLTQPVFSMKDVERLARCKEHMQQIDPNVKLFCGLMPLVSLKNALFIQNEMAGINVPDEVVARYREGMTREEGEEVGVSVVNEVIRNTKGFADGYYFSIPFNRTYLLEDILPVM